MRTIGRGLQLFALVLLPLAIAMQLFGALGRIGVDQMLIMLVCGIAAFLLGRLLEGYAGQ
ncbi:MAG: hypothetical protein GTO53_13670 [Planctomycetales bacterium]|nr:hypothetical protein [Planctomycetales bacterium]NIM10139.1 hypothetical protein [Planctomycetales bacterium]NIN08381.1 hypothetical protein [Planctomycetales bacterium]NIN77509.1 hypothetical protein [Planctomycetales bacterium]NIO34681.1 hypothetical protein [Planctomycetales bacterium]